MDKKIHIQELIQARNLASQDECAKFENALSALWGKLEADDLDDVLKAFSDETADDELMFSLVHLVGQGSHALLGELTVHLAQFLMHGVQIEVSHNSLPPFKNLKNFNF